VVDESQSGEENPSPKGVRVQVPQGRPRELDSEIKKLWETGLGARLIASKLGVKHQASVFKRFRKLGLKRDKNFHLLPKLQHSYDLNKDHQLFRKAAEYYVKYIFILSGATVLSPELGSSFDLLVSSPVIGDFKKVQIKTSTHKPKGHFVFSIQRVRTNTKGVRRIKYADSECDFVCLVSFNEDMWLIPFSEVKNQKTITTNVKYKNYKIK
jgi:hypothetical protein